ncbi:TPA: helicase-related protein [Pasteurella multocida]
MHNNLLEDYINILNREEKLSFNNSFLLAQYCSRLFNNSEFENARLLTILALDNWNKIHIGTINMWSVLIELMGFYPYLNRISTKLNKNILGDIRAGMHKSENLKDKYLHEEQLKVLSFLEKKNLILSAPTSFGKSLLIEELIASDKFSNIVIIQPTLALLDETRKKLISYNQKYKIIVRTSQRSTSRNIFLFTAERVNEYDDFKDVDLLIVDEFYKISGKRDDERSSSLNTAFYNLWNKFRPKFYMLGPNINSIPKSFEEKYNAIFYKTDYSLVNIISINVYEDYPEGFGNSNRGKKYESKKLALFKLLERLKDEQTIIYCSSPNRVNSLSWGFYQYLIENNALISNHTYSIKEWIEININKKWNLYNLLSYDIGIHDGTLPKHVNSSTINYFNNNKIKYLFCTSTIIEGVNTSAKNIIYFDNKKGGRNIDFFDYSNIKGRSGRMMVHYVGNIYNFSPIPEKENIHIDFPFFQQDPISDEVLIQLEDKDIIRKDTKQYIDISNIPQKEREIIKKNGVSVLGQRKIIEKLRSDIIKDESFIVWSGIPTYEQLRYVLRLSWENLIIEGETTKPMTIGKLVTITHNYAQNRDFRLLINDTFEYYKQNDTDSEEIVLNKSIRECFHTLKHWIQYKIPKWLSTCNELQKLVANEYNISPGNYSYYAKMLENDFIQDNLSILLELGIPISAIKKIEKVCSANLDEDKIISEINKQGFFNKIDLIDYEKEKFEENLNVKIR